MNLSDHRQNVSKWRVSKKQNVTLISLNKFFQKITQINKIGEKCNCYRYHTQTLKNEEKNLIYEKNFSFH